MIPIVVVVVLVVVSTDSIDCGWMVIVVCCLPFCHQTTFAMENVKDTMATVDAMKSAHKSLKADVKKINIDKVEVR